jgi:5-methylcytosine-specific restriction enzyme A
MRPCARHGCGGLTRGKYCDADAHLEREQQRARDRRRGSATQRRYGSHWRRYSKAYIAQHPLCHYCERIGRVSATECVDHAVPPSRGGEFWDGANHRPACLTCNSRKGNRTEAEYLALLGAPMPTSRPSP